MDRTHTPASKDVRDVLVGLLFREVALSPSTTRQKYDEGTTVSEFIDDQSTLAAVAVLDLPLAAWIGAAIGLLPSGGARDAIDERDLSPTLLDNLTEVLNVLGGVFVSPGQPHVRRGRVYGPGVLPPEHVTQLAQSLVLRLDFVVEIAGYGSGALSIVVA